MCSANKMLFIAFIHCWILLFTETIGLELNRLDQSSQHETKIFNPRFKRDGGTIPFRPLFVYRQQQKEKQARWKLEAAQKLAQQEQFQLQSHQNAIGDYFKYQISNPYTKTDYNYRRDPVHSYYQSNPTYQPYQNYQYYPENSYEISPYRSSGRLYFANQQESYYGKYDSDYYS